MIRLTACACCVFALALMLPLAVLAKDNPDVTQFGNDIRIEAGQKTADVTCFNCSIHVRGQVTGDVTAFHGNITLEQCAEVAGDVTTIWGNIHADSGARMAGDVTSIAGGLRIQSQAVVNGDRTSFEGTLWLLAVLLLPVLFLALIVALIVWLIRRSHGTEMPAYVKQGAL